MNFDRSWLKLSDDLDGALSSMHISPAAGALLIDKPVLARRTSDGLYYNGRVKSQVHGITKKLKKLYPLLSIVTEFNGGWGSQ